MATQNPVETGGTFRCRRPNGSFYDAAVRLDSDGKRGTEELERFTEKNPLTTLEAVCSKVKYCRCVNLHRRSCDQSIRNYIVQIVQQQKEQTVHLCQPSRSLALMKACQVYAAINGRDYVILEAVKELAQPVLAHRLICYTGTHSGRGKKPLQQILNTIEVPSEEWDIR